MTLDPDSLERLVPEDLIAGDTTGSDTLDLHRARYEFASRFLSAAGRCLDIACGVGYGTRLLARRGGRVVSVLGVDISPAAIDHARRQPIHHHRLAVTTVTDGKRVLVIPAYDEAPHLTGILENILEAAEGFDVVVVDDGSRDRTGKIASETG